MTIAKSPHERERSTAGTTPSGLVSAGLLVWRRGPAGVEFLLGHPGGPFWKNKDAAGWSIPKGLVEPGESLRAAAGREFAEETGVVVTDEGVALPPCRTPGRKVIHAWLVEADLDVARFVSNAFTLEWPPRSGRVATFPEIDRAAYFDPATALVKIHRGQRPIVESAIASLAAAADPRA